MSSSSNNKAAAILRASLARRTDPNSTTGPSPGSSVRSSAGGLGRLGLPPSGSSHRRNATDVTYTLEGEDVEIPAGSLEDPTPLTDSIHGPDGITSSSGTGSRSGSAARAGRNSIHDGHGDIESALHHHTARRSSSASSLKGLGLPRRLSSAKNLVKQVSGLDLRDVALSDDVNGDNSPTSAAAHFPSNGGASRSSGTIPSERDPYAPKDLNTSHSSSIDDHGEVVRHDSLFIRFVHSRWMQLGVAAAAIVLIGAVVGVTQSNKNAAGTTSGSGTTSGGYDDAYAGGDGGGYYPEPTRPSGWPEEEQQVEEPSSTNAGASSSSPADDGASSNQPASPSSPTTPSTASATWFQGPHFTDPSLTTLGSTLSLSKSGTRLAISSKHSSTVQIVRENSDGSWSELGQSLPGKVAALSGDGTKVAIADPSESTVTTYALAASGQQWQIYGTRLIDLWGARAVALNDDGTTLAISHHPDSICRVCPSVATVYELRTDGEAWLQEYDMLGAYDFDFSVDLSGDGTTLLFSGRVYENTGAGMWNIKNSFPDFISSHSALNSRGSTAAVALPDCHIFKNTDPTLTECTNTETHEVSIMEYIASNTASGGYWNRKGISIGPEVNGPAGTTAISLSEDGNTVAVAVGGRGMGGEAAIPVGDTDDILADEPLNGGGSSGALDEPMPLDDNGPLRRRLQQRQDQERNGDDSNEDFLYDAYDVPHAYVRVYRYDDSTGDWYTVGEDIKLDTSGATVTLSADGRRLALGVPYGGEDERGYVKVYNLIMA